MNKTYFIKTTIILFLLVTFTASSQNLKGLWTSVGETKAIQTDQVFRKISLKTEKYFKLNLEELKNKLQNVGTREHQGNTIIAFPNSNGELHNYRVFETPMMELELQAEYPNIKTYAGQGIENPSEIIRFSITSKGFHGMFLGMPNGTQFIDPFSDDGNIYTVYSKQNIEDLSFGFECGLIDDPKLNNIYENATSLAKNADDGMLRNYRLAVACTGEYTAFHGGTVADALAAVVVTMNRVNGIFERDLSITMTLVANNSSLIYTDGATDPFDNDSTNTLINQSQSIINGTIGSGNYDIGHTFSTGAGGLAGLGVTCNNNNKARGVTGVAQPVGDSFDIDFVAHELGHQFGAPHTFNGTVGNCSGGNRSAANAYEPGSGSTIMAYAGICGSDNIRIGSDAYFHRNSIFRIWNHVSGTGSCPVNRTATGNTEPVANAGADYIIPQGTPYKLDGSNSSDVDGLASLTYTWEQYDLGTAGVPAETTLTGPLVRSYEGTINPIRYIPRLVDVVSNGGVSTTWEKLATVNRAINFTLTVRDNDASGGQTDSDGMTATVTTSAGPFTVTSQNTGGISWDVGSSQTITWDVAGTTGNGVNEANVNILLSTDGGLNFDTVLASNTPNDGSQSITVPNVASSNCRIMVEAANGIFFNVNSSNFGIGVDILCTTYTSGNIALAIPDGGGENVQGAVVANTINVPDSGTITDFRVSIDVTHSYIGDLIIQLQHPNGTAFTNIWNRTCNTGAFGNIDVTFKDGEPTISCASPTIGLYEAANTLSVFNGLDMSGDWTILLVDNYTGDTGTLNNWSMEFCSEALSIAENELDNLNIYPNPNNGEFNIGFNPKTGEAISIDVYDIRGRSIYSNVYSSVGRFEETIALSNAQSGVYMLTISDGLQKVTKKIIVE
ncbi:T9SS type A sorting domain-containing protein [Winogradskyella litoriviva]|uniref:T9SS type A sorting domain-containing protein n=1 Tax=Winogradskyella litoriviva TaxID=1220182 RepID=A0ABX2E2I2_9FLAO|nr:zinc-dependent metalloprotease family protein [Winogradskyella litoriviva]NRD22253.1 T9SS type A sorting domain-containing protein [Winogradskyella litoriviva]